MMILGSLSFLTGTKSTDNECHASLSTFLEIEIAVAEVQRKLSRKLVFWLLWKFRKNICIYLNRSWKRNILDIYIYVNSDYERNCHKN